VAGGSGVGLRRVAGAEFPEIRALRYRLDPPDPQNPETLYDREWALALLDRVVGRVEEECVVAGKEAAFEHLKGFLTAGGGDAAHADAATRLGMEPGAVRVAVHLLRKRYRELLRDEIAQTLSDPAGVDEEMRSLLEALR